MLEMGMMRLLSLVLLCSVGVRADEFDDLRLRWRQTLTGTEM